MTNRVLLAGMAALALVACDEETSVLPVPDLGTLDQGTDAVAPTIDCGELAEAGEATVSLPGMTCPAEVVRDAHGIVHAKCATNADCYRVEGYFHAADRFAQMDIRRRAVLGELAAAATNIVLPVDIEARQFYADPRTGTPLADVMLERASPEALAMLDAYSEGVNAWLEQMRAGEAELADEYNYPLIDQGAIRDWTPRDSMATILALLESLTNRTDLKVWMGAQAAALPAELMGDVYGLTPGTRSAILPSAGASKRGSAPDVAALRQAKARLAPWRLQLENLAAHVPDAQTAARQAGSNNWAVHASRSATGNALLCDDPHLGLSNPSTWYVVHLDAATAGTGDLNIAGVSFAGLPSIVLGQNAHIAWGATNSRLDQSDVYLETLTPDGTGVMYQGMEVPFVEREVTIPVSMGEPHVETLRWVPHHGPVLSIDREAGTAITGRWVGHEGGTDLDFLLTMPRAKTVEEGREALKVLTAVGQNFVLADRAGSIGWFPYSWVPARPWASPAVPQWLPLPGDGSAEWGAFLDYAELPQAINPPAGVLATANNDMSGHVSDGDPTNDGQAWLQTFVEMGKRHERIVEMLEAGGDTHDLAGMEAMLADVRSNLGAELWPLAAQALGEHALDEGAATVKGVLDGWNFECPTGFDGYDPETAAVDPATSDAAVGCAAFHVFWFALREATFGDELAAAGQAGEIGWPSPMLLHLSRPDALAGSYWDDVSTENEETAADTIARALDLTSARLTEWLGADPAGWQWGRLHTTTLRADLFSAAGLSQFDNGPFYNDGGQYTVDVADPDVNVAEGDFGHRWGASMRLACEVKPETGPDCTLQLPGGQRHYRESANYDDLLRKWLHNESVPLETDWAAIEGETTVFGPQ